MRYLSDVQKKAQEEKQKAQEKEEKYMEGIRQLQPTVTTLILDIRACRKQLQTGIPPVILTVESFASVAVQEVLSTDQEAMRTLLGSTKTSASFGLLDQSSPTTSPLESLKISIRSTIKQRTHKTRHAVGHEEP
jgi:hypothetical protein